MFPQAQTLQILFPVLCFIFLGLTFKNTVYGAIAYFIVLTSKLGDMYPVLGAMRIELVVAAVVLISISFSPRNLSYVFSGESKLNISIWPLFLVSMVSMVGSVDITESWTIGGYNLIKMMLFYVMMVSSIQTHEDLRKLGWAFVLITGWIAYEPVTNYLQGITGLQGYGEIAYGSFGAATGHVALANTLSQGLPLTFFWARSEKNNIKKIFIFSLVVLLILGIIFTKSRGGFIGLMTFGACVVYFSKNRSRAFFIFLIVVALTLPFAGADYINRIVTIGDGISGGRSSSDRYIGLVNGFSMMLKRPLLGVGIGCFARARSMYFNYYFFSHNLYGELLGELGLASIAWFSWVYLMFRTASRIKKVLDEDNEQHQFYRNILMGIQSGLAVRLVLGNFSHCAFIWFWFVMAVLIVGTERLVQQAHVENSTRQEEPAESPEMSDSETIKA
jgi:hypothetical protein